MYRKQLQLVNLMRQKIWVRRVGIRQEWGVTDRNLCQRLWWLKCAPHGLIGSGTIRCGPVEVYVALLEKVCHWGQAPQVSYRTLVPDRDNLLPLRVNRHLSTSLKEVCHTTVCVCTHTHAHTSVHEDVNLGVIPQGPSYLVFGDRLSYWPREHW